MLILILHFQEAALGRDVSHTPFRSCAARSIAQDRRKLKPGCVIAGHATQGVSQVANQTSGRPVSKWRPACHSTQVV